MKIKPGPPALVPSCVTDALPRLLRQAVSEVQGNLREARQEASSSSDDDELELMTDEDSK